MTNLTKGSLIMLCAIIALVVLFLVFILYLTKKKETEKANKSDKTSTPKSKLGVPFDDIKNFLPFDDIKDGMIIQEKGDRYTMLVECEGINYDLMSEAEKISVEEGFIQFLNSLRFPIQIYVQSRTINLDNNIKSYNEQLAKHQEEFDRLLDVFKNLDEGGAPDEKLIEIGNKLEKKEKVLDYTKDLIENISELTQNTNVLQKKYYIVVSYHVSEMGLINNLDQNQILKIAYTELSNRADSICGGISSCGIESHILDDVELTEAMYIAVNRDDADIFNIQKVIDSDISAIATTAVDPMIKRQELLKEERRARELREKREREIRFELEERESHYSNGVDSSTIL